MPWVIHAKIAFSASATILALGYWNMYLENRDRPLALWASGWTLQGLFHALGILAPQNGPPSASLLIHLVSLTSAWAILLGTREFVFGSASSGWNRAVLAGALWTCATSWMPWPFLIEALPVFLLLGAISAATGLVLLKGLEIKRLHRRLTGWCFILFGLHQTFYPLLSNHDRFALWAGPASAIFGLLAALGVLHIYLHNVRTDFTQSEDLYRLLFHRANDAILIHQVNPDGQTGRFVEVNDIACRRLGYSREEILALTPLDLIPPEQLELAGELWDAILEQRHVLYEIVHLASDGRRIPVEINAHIMDLHGTPTVMNIVRDITDRKINEASLKESEERYRQLFKDNPLPMWVYDRRTLAFLAVNDTAVATYGYSKNEFLNMTIRDIRDPVSVPALLESVREEPGPLRKAGTWKHRWKDGTPRDVEITTHDLVFDAREARLVLANDVTERIQAEENERRSRCLSAALADSTLAFLQSGDLKGMAQILIERCRSITDAEFGLIFDLNRDGNARFLAEAKDLSTTVQKALYTEGLSAGEETDLFTIPSEENLIFAPITRHRTILANEPHRHPCPGGKVLEEHPPILSFLGTPLKVGSSIVGMIALFNRPGGFTEREQREVETFAQTAALAIQSARTELARNQAEEYLRQAQKMEAVGQLAGGVAHDFNNLLTVINGYGSLLLRALPQKSGCYHDAEQIVEAGERAAGLTRQLLAFSRRQVLEPKVLDLNRLIRDLEKILRRLIREDIKIVLSLDDRLDRVKADPGQAEQIFMNLLVNARDALPSGGKITVETANVELDRHFVTTHEGAAAGRYVMMSISDTGIGMSREIRERVFEPFFTTKEQGRGTGLGLATVYGIVRQSGGYIEVDSTPGRGSVFRVFLPRTDEAPEPDAVVRTAHHNVARTVLIVEDDEQVLNLAAAALKSYGYAVLQTQHPEEALKLFERRGKDIDLLLTDVIMPELSGPRLAARLRDQRPHLKVLFMSGHAHLGEDEALPLDIHTEFIQKPFTTRHLLHKIDQILAQQTFKKRGSHV